MALRDPRIVFFCPSVSADCARLEGPVSRLLEGVGAPPASLAPLADVGSLHVAGWRVFMLRSAGATSPARDLSQHLGEAVCAVAAELGRPAMGLYVAPSEERALLSRCAPAGGPETFAGRRDAVLACATSWFGVPAVDLAPLFGLEPEGAGAPDAEDVFVDAKLREARALMERQWSPETHDHPAAPAWAAFIRESKG